MPTSSPVRKQVSLNGNAGAFTPFTVPGTARRIEIIEDAGAAAQGYAFQLPDDSFATTYSVSATISQTTPTVFGQEISKGVGAGRTLGWKQQSDPMGNVRAADVICQLRSLTVTANKVNIAIYT